MSRCTDRYPLPSAAAALAAAAALVAGCGGTAQDQDLPPERDSPPANAGTLLSYAWLLAPTVEQQPPLAAPLALSVDPSGNRLLILETVPPEVRVHELTSGRFVRRLGREGGGPGEYRYPRAMATSASGVTAVLSLNGRVTLWGRDSSLLGTYTSGTGMASDIIAVTSDTFIVKTDVFPPDDVSEFRHMTPAGVVSEPFYRDDGLPGIEQPGLPLRNHAYAVGTSADGSLLLSPPGPEYVVLAIDAGGRVGKRSVRLEVPPLHRTEAEIEELREAVSQGFAASGHAPPARIPIPPYRSHLRRLDRSPDGKVWALTGRGPESEAIIDVFAADGAYLNTYRLQLEALDLAVTRNAIYLLGQSPADIPGVAVAERPDIDLLTVSP